jgi:uncharacterized Zn-binding protein involved in type VI secretion
LGSPAARLKDKHTCPVGIHVGGPITGPCCTSVLIENMPAATVGDTCHCAGVPDIILTGSSCVLIGGKPAARMGDKTVHGGVIITGCASVLIGDIGGGLDTTADFLMPSEEEKVRIINETIQACIMLLRKKLNLLKNNDAATLEDFEEWFGTWDGEAKHIIIHRIERELELFEYITHHDFEVIQNDEIRVESGAQVYSYDELHTIYLGDKFLHEEREDNRSRANVLIHELSHFEFIGDTRDFDYGLQGCQDLAKNNRSKALYNADTFAFFIES